MAHTTARLAGKKRFDNSNCVPIVHIVLTTLSHLAAFKKLNRKLVDELLSSFKSSTSFLYVIFRIFPANGQRSSHYGHDPEEVSNTILHSSGLRKGESINSIASCPSARVSVGTGSAVKPDNFQFYNCIRND